MLLNDAMFLVLDTETTGFSHQDDRVVQVGAVWLDKNLEVVDQYESLVNPGDVKIPAMASSIHHLVDEDVAGAPRLEEVLKAIEKKSKYNALAAHNAPFDMGFIKPPSSIPVLDTLRLARKLWPEIESHKNQFLRYHFKLPVPGAKGQMAHSALPDALSTAAFLKYAVTHLRATAKNDPGAINLLDLIEWLKKPMFLANAKCKFGKHRGKTWNEIAQSDKSYLSWMLSPKGMTDLDMDIKFTCEKLTGVAV